MAQMGSPFPGSHLSLSTPCGKVLVSTSPFGGSWGTRQGHAHKCRDSGPPPGERSPGSCALRLEAESLPQGPSQPIAMDLFWFLGCSVESSDVNWKKKKSGGIKIMCQSEIRDFSAMAFITDHVNSLIDQWFPGKKAFLNQALAHGSISL